MRISDWSSDVCSSDLHPAGPVAAFRSLRGSACRRDPVRGCGRCCDDRRRKRCEPDQPLPAEEGGRTGIVGPERKLPEERQHHLYWRPGSKDRSEEHTSELQSLMRISYAVFCLKKKKQMKNKLTKR